jgi:hypothetical protein
LRDLGVFVVDPLHAVRRDAVAIGAVTAVIPGCLHRPHQSRGFEVLLHAVPNAVRVLRVDLLSELGCGHPWSSITGLVIVGGGVVLVVQGSQKSLEVLVNSVFVLLDN